MLDLLLLRFPDPNYVNMDILLICHFFLFLFLLAGHSLSVYCYEKCGPRPENCTHSNTSKCFT